MTTSALLRLCACIAIVCMAADAAAQEPPVRPYSGLFGGNERDPDRRQALDLTASLQGAHDDNVLAGTEGVGTVPDPRFQVRGVYSQYTADLSYGLRSGGNAVRFGASASAEVRQSPSVSGLSEPSYAGSLGLSATKTRGALSFDVQQSATYFPYRVLSMLPRPEPESLEDLLARPGLDFGITSRATVGTLSGAHLGMRLSPRSSLNIGYDGAVTAHVGTTDLFINHSLAAGLTHRMTPHASLRLGYGYRLASYSGSLDRGYLPSHSIDAGIDYNRALSFSRRTSLGFTTGTAGASDGAATRYFMTGGAVLTHDIGRTWNARAAYQRDLSFLEGLATPFLSSGVTLSVGGYMGRRVDMVLTAGYADAVNDFSTAGSVATYTGAGRLRVALTRYGSAYVQYFHYQYRFDDADAVRGILPPSMERSGVRGGLTFWLPLLR